MAVFMLRRWRGSIQPPVEGCDAHPFFGGDRWWTARFAFAKDPGSSFEELILPVSIILAWTSNCAAGSASGLSPVTEAGVTFAVTGALSFRRVFLVMVDLFPALCRPPAEFPLIPAVRRLRSSSDETGQTNLDVELWRDQGDGKLRCPDGAAGRADPRVGGGNPQACRATIASLA